MKIAHIVWAFETGGIETMLVHIANEQFRLGETVRLYIINNLYEQALLDRLDERIKVTKIGRKPGGKNPWPFLKLNMLLACSKPDVIHCHVFSIINIIQPSLHKKCVMTRHATGTPSPMIAETLRKYRQVFAISEAVHDNLLEHYGVESIVVKNGIPTSSITKRNYHKPSRPLRIVSTGRLLVEVKGQDVLIQAMSLLPGLDIHLDIVGDGPDKGMLRSLIEELNQTDRITLCGNWPQPYLYEHLCDYDLFIMASNYEGFGLTIVEASAAMLPVIVTDVEGPKEVVENGKYGHLFKVGNTQSCADAIRQVYEKYDDEECLRQARQNVCQLYDVKRTAEEYLKLYHSNVIG